MKLGYTEPWLLRTLGYNKQILGQIGHFTTQINPIIKKPGYTEEKWPASYNRV
jgi:hypothetical protein